MSHRSQKAMMREALQTTERNLSSLINARYANHVMMQSWRDVCRRALGTLPYAVEPDADPSDLLRGEILPQP